jgi:hypothetical protein
MDTVGECHIVARCTDNDGRLGADRHVVVQNPNTNRSSIQKKPNWSVVAKLYVNCGQATAIRQPKPRF